MKLKAKVSLFILSTVCILTLDGCDGSKDGRELWDSVLKKCASSDLLGPKTFYFGPSNEVGVASIWRKSNDGGYYLRALRSRYSTNSDFVVPGKLFTCSGTSVSSSEISGNLALESSLSPVTGDLGADLKKAKKVTLKIDQAQWERLEEIPWEQVVGALDPNNPIKQDLAKDERYLMVTALRIKGMVTNLEFSSDVASEIKAKYQNANLGVLKTGDLGIGLNAKFVNNTTLEITSASDFYVGGELRHVNSTGVSGPGKALGKVEEGVEKAPAGVDQVELH